MKFEFPLVHGLDTPAMTWSKTETYDSYEHEYVTVLQKRILFFSSEKGILLGERAGLKLVTKRRWRRAGSQFGQVCGRQHFGGGGGGWGGGQAG